jgi:transposase-like protein
VRRYDEKIRRKAIELYEQDVSMASIAERPEMPTAETISRWLRQEGYEVVKYSKSAGTRYGLKARREALRLHRQGHPIAALTRRKGLPNNPKVIRKWLEDAGETIDWVPPLMYPRAEILKKLKAGVPRNDLAEQYGCSLKFLSQLATGKISPRKKTANKK